MLLIIPLFIIGTLAAQLNTTGFLNSSIILSSGKKAVCVNGIIPISVSANNTNFLYSGPVNNFETTNLFIEYTQSNSTIVSTLSGGEALIEGTYNIFSKLCFPVNATRSSTVQVLTHGGTLDRNYWDLAPNYSYVDEAAMAGYATFSYDRLGTGLSTHPDPIQVLQMAIQVEILHILTQELRLGGFAGYTFEKVVGVGHSIGSGLTQAVTTKYPQDFDAVILTGHSTSFADALVGAVSLLMQIANTDPSGRFENLPNGYFSLPPIEQAHQFAFYRYPFFDIDIFNSQMKTSQTNAFGELWTLASVYAPAPSFTGPVDVVDGENDYFYCRGDCTYPTNQADLAVSAFYPAASNGSQSFLVPNAGHNINAHFTASQAFQQMITFLQSNDIY